MVGFMNITYREAVRSGMREALQRDPRVFLMGEDVGKYGGTYACSKGFLEEFGPERIQDTPLGSAKMTINATTGVFSGSLLGGGKSFPFGGVIYQKGEQRGEGFYFNESGTGKATITPTQLP